VKKLFLMMLIVVSTSGTYVAACDFDCTLNRHLNAIKTRDFEAFESTLTQGDRLTFILPNGKFRDDPIEYRKVLKSWLGSPGWTFDYEVVAVEKTSEMGSALLLVSYNEADRDGSPYHLDHYLSLVFKKEGNGWYLVHDQNTATILTDP
jgi:ketosteroid isomerase-like protein